jgi:diguanylate cyclase (GGDEF)-like protein
VGDEVLRQVSSLFQEQLRKVDVVCRYGGEEYAVLLTHASDSQAATIAEKLRRAVEKWMFPGVPRTVTISAGVAGFGAHGVTRDELIQAADRALYRAKQGGRNRICIPEQAQGASTGR